MNIFKKKSKTEAAAPVEVEIMKPGRYIDSKGNETEFTADDLAECAESYNAESAWRAPLVLGHPKTDDPAYGWIDSLKVEGGKLVAQIGKISQGLTNAIRDGLYRNHSASFYKPDNPRNPTPGKLYLKHLGFLGATPPAVKDLEPISLSEDDGATEINFSEPLSTNEFGSKVMAINWKFESVYQILRAMKNRMIETDGAEKADKLIPEWTLEELQRKLKMPETETAGRDLAFAENEDSDAADPSTRRNTAAQGDTGDAPHEVKDNPKKEGNTMTEQEQQALKDENERLKKANAEEAKNAKRREIAEFAESKLVKTGKMTPAQRESFIELGLALDAAGDIEFSEGGEKVKKNGYELLCEFAESLTASKQSAGGAKFTAETAAEKTVEFGEGDSLDPSIH